MRRNSVLWAGAAALLVAAGCGSSGTGTGQPKGTGDAVAGDGGGEGGMDAEVPADEGAVSTDGLSSDVVPSDAEGGGDPGGPPGCDPPCVAPEKCIEKVCQLPKLCQPGTWVCHGLMAKKQCNPDGTGFLEPEGCPGDQYCTSGQCGLKCNLDPKWGAYVGCVFWTVDLPVWDDPTLPKAKTLPHAVVVSNPNELETKVTFEPPPGIVFSATELLVPGLSSKEFLFPSMDTSGSDIFDLAVRLESTRPVLVHQFNPWDNTYSNDASLLLPEPLLGQEHLVLSWPTDTRCLLKLDIPGLPFDPSTFGGPCSHSTLTVAAPYNDTSVTIRTTAPVMGTQIPEGAEGEVVQTVKPMAVGSVQTFTLNKGQVLNLDALPADMFGIADLTGTLVVSDKPVAVFSGHDSTAIVAPADGSTTSPDPDDTGSGGCCLDHLEEQMIPVPLLGTQYVAAKSADRGGEKDGWRIVAAEAGVTITTNPPIDGLHGKKLSLKGDFVQAFTTESFEIQASGRVLVGQYLVSQGDTEDVIGDPALILAIPVERFRATYPIMVPPTYALDYITVVREPGTSIELDGASITDGYFESFAGGKWEIAWVKVADGVHVVTGSKPFSLSAYGYDSAASYGYPGGMTIPGESNP